MTRRHEEIIKIVTNTLPTSMNKLRSDSSKLAEMYTHLNKAILDLQNLQKKNISSLEMKSNHNNNLPISPQRHLQTNTDDKLIQNIKQMILSQIEQIKQGFNTVDNNIKTQIDRIAQQMNSSNTKMYQNWKGIQDKYKQNIIDCCDANYKKRMNSHESILKGYLQKISQKLQHL